MTVNNTYFGANIFFKKQAATKTENSDWLNSNLYEGLVILITLTVNQKFDMYEKEMRLKF